MEGEGKRMSVLIVDDERTSLEILNQILRESYDVYVAKSGKVAIERACALVPDVILLDVIMPDMNGFSVLDKLREIQELRNSRVIFITGLRSESDEAHGLLMGAVDYITKPFHHEIVRARVRNQMQVVQQLRTIEAMSFIDSNTGIANRRSFDKYLEVEWGRSIREHTVISHILIDLDHFKKYNDTYGHMLGDILLRAVAEAISKCCCRSSDHVSRFGGDEFSVLLPNTDIQGAERMAESIRLEIAGASVLSNDLSLNVTASIGVVATKPGSSSCIDAFIEESDKMLYKAKAMGRNIVCASELEE